ncbi:MAG: alpha/beta hydrolase family protein [Bryobacteraceae bacterium]
MRPALLLPLIHSAVAAWAAGPLDLPGALAKPILGPRQTTFEVQVYAGSRVPHVRVPGAAAEWERAAAAIRQRVLRDVFLRGEAARWNEFKGRIEWLEDLQGSGYRVRKLRYEVVPGLWTPALFYEPQKLAGKIPVVLNVNGHETTGVATPYIQERCINLAKRGVLALNVEWFGRGQLSTPGFNHGLINQLDLCGTAGVALHFLSQRRALDILLASPHADPARVAVTGLSGGGWQTITISALDTRVKLANPVAGYSSFVTRTQFPDLDLGDAEQTPSDLATVADYTHFTAMLAPRPALLTNNSRDTCCFRADYAISPLLAAAGPVYELFGKRDHLRYHINYDEGHNYGRDNREAFYRMLRDFFYGGSSRDFPPEDIPSANEVRDARQLHVPMPEDNLDFQKIALQLSRSLPRSGALPDGKAAITAWQKTARPKLRQIVRVQEYQVRAGKVGEARLDAPTGVRATYWRLKMGETWTVPAVELEPPEPRSTVVVAADKGRAGLAAEVEKLLGERRRVLAVDPFYFGESQVPSNRAGRGEYLFAILLAAVGDRPLGIQASQLTAVSRWLEGRGAGKSAVAAFGPRTSLIALIAAAMDPQAVGGLELHDSYGTLKEVIEQNLGSNTAPELFCFGLLEHFDIRHLLALAAPRPVSMFAPGERVKKELAGVDAVYRALGAEFDRIGLFEQRPGARAIVP